MWLLVTHVLVSEKKLKRKLVERLPLIWLACFIYKCKSSQEVQLPQKHLSFLQNFIFTKYLNQEVDDDLSVCVDKHLWPLYKWRYKDLSMSHYQKVMMLLPPMEKCPIHFYHGTAFTAQI